MGPDFALIIRPVRQGSLRACLENLSPPRKSLGVRAVIWVLADKLAYSRSLGFQEQGTLRRQTRLGDLYEL